MDADLARPTPICVKVNDDRRITASLTAIGMISLRKKAERKRTYELVELGSGGDFSNHRGSVWVWWG
jgi:hypothetical protein